jgi:hypothetical protein
VLPLRARLVLARPTGSNALRRRKVMTGCRLAFTRPQKNLVIVESNLQSFASVISKYGVVGTFPFNN